MRLLLDTQAFLWFVTGDRRLSRRAREAIERADSERLLSLASIWEIAIKASLGRLELEFPLHDLVHGGATQNGIGLLPIAVEHVMGVADLPFHHRDPFDRLLAVQAVQGGLTLVSADEAFDRYTAQRLW